MATDIKWKAAESLTSLLTTELNSLANSTSASTGKVLSGAITMSSDLREFIAFQLDVTYGSAPSSGGYVGLWMVRSIDATNFEDGDTSTDPSKAEEVIFPLRAVTTAQRIIIPGFVVPPYDFKILLRNKAGQAMSSSGNTLKYSRYILNLP